MLPFPSRFQIGDIVDIPSEGIYAAEVVGIFPDWGYGPAIMIACDKTNINHGTFKLLSQNYIDTFIEPHIQKAINSAYVGDFSPYIGRHGGVAAEAIVVLATKQNPIIVAKPIEHSCSRICAKCGQFDEYAAPSAKHNNQVMCYRCFVR